MLGIAVLAVLAGGYGYWLHQSFYAPGPSGQTLRIQVTQGERLKSVLTELTARGALQAPCVPFVKASSSCGAAVYLRVAGLVTGLAAKLGLEAHLGVPVGHAASLASPRVQVGTYEIAAHATPAQIIEQLAQGRVVFEQVTIIEGSTFAEFRHALDSHPEVTHALQGKSDSQVMAALGHAGELAEGRFFPDTYHFAALTADLDILAMAYDKMQHLITAEWPRRSPDLPFSTPYEALTLASIIEKESALASERPRIAGVFVNRLRKGMRLQTDPSVIYGLGAGYDGSIHSRDLTQDTPYNTYTRSGLPPTPIGLPSKEAVLAALHPLVSDELYFVATANGNGGHHFSRTLEEHNAAVRTYVSRRAQQGATVAPGAR